MPLFPDDPSHLSKESLKSELIAHNVALPIGERKKEVYLQLYMKHVYSKKSTDFSSDEEEEPPEEGNVSDQQVEEKVFMKNSKMMDICQMNDEELKAKLLEHGVIPGPIVASTRLVYEKKLLKLISQKSESSSFKNNATVIEDQYSDSEEDEEEMESTMVQKKMKKTAKAIGNHTHVLTENNINNDDKKEDILAELFPNEPRTPTGISATRRKPIKGAAGRPIQFKYNLTEKAQLSSRVESTPATPRQLVPVVIQIVVFLLVVCFLFLIYQAMEVNQDFYVENESHFEAVDQNVPLPVAEEAAQPSSPMAIQE